jgi:uncharacterized alkaline shock family protein YloU
MNLFNRVLILLLSLLVLTGAVLVLLAMLGVAPPEQLAPTPWVRDRLQGLVQLDPPGRARAIIASAVALLLAIVLAFLELLPARRDTRLVVKQDALGRVTVTQDVVRELVRREAGLTAGIMEVHPRLDVDNRGLGLRIQCRVSVDPTASLPELTEQFQERVKASIEHHLGRPVAEVSVNTQLAPLADRQPRRRVR